MSMVYRKASTAISAPLHVLSLFYGHTILLFGVGAIKNDGWPIWNLCLYAKHCTVVTTVLVCALSDILPSFGFIVAMKRLWYHREVSCVAVVVLLPSWQTSHYAAFAAHMSPGMKMSSSSYQIRYYYPISSLKHQV